MSDFLLSYGVASYITQNILIVPFQADFYMDVIEALRADILQKIHQNPMLKGLIIDLSNMPLIDVQNMKMLEKTLQMATLLGVTGFLVGIKPSVTLALVELGYEPGGLNTALSIEQASELILDATTNEDIVEEAELMGDEAAFQVDDNEPCDEH